uniref:Uncharacterized protein n=1 Tax=Panagrolaimus sp. PS1159 TaxID=55785 RepID=A0AC35GMB0_9BILA
MDGKNIIKTYEINSAVKVDENDPLNNLVGITKNGSFKSISRGIKQVETHVLETCSKEFFPHGLFIDWLTKIPKMYCEEHRCLNPAKIKCQKNIKMHDCSSSTQWITGFMKRNYGNHEIIVAECCQYSEAIESAFIKHVNITGRGYWTHEIFVENEKLTEMEFFNNIRKSYNTEHGTVYAASVYRLKCRSKAN